MPIKAGRTFSFIYGVAAYFFFLAVFLVFIAFVGDFLPPGYRVAPAPAGGAMKSAVIDFFLIALFGVPHSVMARPAFKNWLTRFLPTHLERSTYVLVSSLLLLLVVWQWQPIGPELWHFEAPLVRYAAYGAFALGWAIIFVATFLTDHFDLFGLRQVYLHLVGRPYTHPVFTQRLFYKTVRHPMMLGMFIALWATPVMSVSHLVLAIGLSLYIVVGVRFEERDLLHSLGEDYRRYHAQTPMFLPGAMRRLPSAMRDRIQSDEA
jgi:protein-S-isoprenylcysteine O-methyltransferase Ste14